MAEDWMKRAQEQELTTEEGRLKGDPESIAAFFSLSGSQVADYTVHRLVG